MEITLDNQLLQIVEDLRFYHQGNFPLKALEEAKIRKEEITPFLLDFLQEVIAKPGEILSDYFGHIFAMYLLAEFREKRAFPYLIKLMRIDEKNLDDLLGDVITEGLPNIIASTYNGDFDAIKAIIEDPGCSLWARDAALRALLALLRINVLKRDDLIAYFAELFQKEVFIADPEMMAIFILTIDDLYPDELYLQIENAFNNDLVDEWLVGLEEIQNTLKQDKDEVLSHLFKSRSTALIDNAISEMSWLNTDKYVQKEKDNEMEVEDEYYEDDPLPIAVTYVRDSPKIGRNAPCPCGSGKKYKKCCINTQ